MNFFDDIKKRVEQDKPFLIAYYGASTTSVEYNAFPNWSQIINYVLKDRLEEEIEDYKKGRWNLLSINPSLDGASSQELLDRFDSLVLNKKPDLIFLDVDKNDVYYKVDENITKENNIKIINKALNNNIKIVLKSEVPALRDNLNSIIIKSFEIDKYLVEKFENNLNFGYIDMFKLFPKEAIDKSYTLVSADDNDDVGFKKGEIDPIHYNKYGNAVVAKILLKEVFNIDFDENKFLRDINDNTKNYPDY